MPSIELTEAQEQQRLKKKGKAFLDGLDAP